MKSKTEEILNITLYTQHADFVWHPVVIDPMADVSMREEAESLLATQRVERLALVNRGERVAD